MLILIATSCELINWIEEYSIASYTSAALKFSHLSGTRRQKLSRDGKKHVAYQKALMPHEF